MDADDATCPDPTPPAAVPPPEAAPAHAAPAPAEVAAPAEVPTLGEVAAPAIAVDARPRSRRRRRLLVVVIAVVAVVLGGGTVAAGAYYSSVGLPHLADLPESSTVYYADGTVLAHLGSHRMSRVGYGELNESVTQATVAAQDPDFWTDTAGPITRADIRIGMDLRDTGVSTRARVAVLARKLEAGASKQYVLEYFLNAASFGRDTFGVEAAAQVYFGKTARRTAPPEQQLTMAEAMVLVAMLDQPELDPADPDSKPGFDPSRGEAATNNSQRRWKMIRDQLRAKDYLTEAEADALVYPGSAVRPDSPDRWPTVPTGSAGLVVSHVLAELAGRGLFNHQPWEKLRNSGLKIFTTLVPQAQRLLEGATDDKIQGSALYGQPATLQAAAVVVEPGTGRVLAYYGGHDGAGTDFAGDYVDDTGQAVGFGAHQPGSVFQVHVLAAALRSGISLASQWRSTSPLDLPGRTGASAVRNNSICRPDQPAAVACTLAEATRTGVNTVFYAVAMSCGPVKVLEMARNAGVRSLWTTDGHRVDLPPGGLDAQVPTPFDGGLALGDYPVTVLDQANAMATYAGNGVPVTAHFVGKVLIGDDVVFGEILPMHGAPRILSSGASADLNWALSQSPSGQLAGGRVSAARTGAAIAKDGISPTDAWIVGYTTQVAMAVWVGNKTAQRLLQDKAGVSIYGSGLPAQIYRTFLEGAPVALHLSATPANPFGPPGEIGTDTPAGSYPG